MFTAQKTTGGLDPRSGSGQGMATTIARGVNVEGNFVSQGDVTIEGDVRGSIATTGLLVIGAESKIVADVKAGDALIAGSIEGNVTVAKQLELKATSKIAGDISAMSVSIEPGACLIGRVAIGAKPSIETDRVKDKSVAGVAPLRQSA